MVITPTPLENVLIILGEGGWVASYATQFRKLFKTRNTHGLSAVNQTLNGAAGIGWATYFAQHHLWFPFVTNIISLTIIIPMLAYTLSNRKQFTRGLTTIAIVGPITSFTLLAFPGASGWMGVVYNNLAASPQLLKILRHKKTSGISAHALLWSTFALTFTFAYALLVHIEPLIVGCLIGYAYYAIVWRYYLRYRHHE